jgi:organic hydroperoxide reductase OsmC/OhrA
MHEYPHHYKVNAVAGPLGEVTLDSENLSSLPSAPPAEFGGPGDLWSPETFLVAAVADCFMLSFRGIARASKMEWISLSSESVGKLERVDGKTRFTGFEILASLLVPPGANENRAQRLLEKAEETCLITNSLTCEVHLKTIIEVSVGVAD